MNILDQSLDPVAVLLDVNVVMMMKITHTGKFIHQIYIMLHGVYLTVCIYKFQLGSYVLFRFLVHYLYKY